MVDLFGLSPVFGGEKTLAFESSRSQSAFRLVEKNFEYGGIVGREAEDVEVADLPVTIPQHHIKQPITIHVRQGRRPRQVRAISPRLLRQRQV